MDANSLAVVGAAAITGLFTFAVARTSKGDARAAAEASLSGTIIAEQNKRIAELQGEMDKMWHNLQGIYQTEQQCRDELREMRHQNRDLMQKVVILEDRLRRLEP